jgi:hypothetical protein
VRLHFSHVRVGAGPRASSIDLKHCPRLERLLGPMSFTRIVLDGCTALRELPDVVKGVEPSLQHCPSLTQLPSSLRVKLLRLEGCSSLRGNAADLRHIDRVHVDELTGIPYDWRHFEVDDLLAIHWLIAGHRLEGLSVRGGLVDSAAPMDQRAPVGAGR